jgi:hypothetical protein
MTERLKIYIDRELFYPMNAAGFIQFAKDRTRGCCAFPESLRREYLLERSRRQ